MKKLRKVLAFFPFNIIVFMMVRTLFKGL